MYFVIVLSAVVGAGLFLAGWYFGDWSERRKSQNPIRKKKRKPRVPKCYVIVPDEGAEPKSKRLKKRSTSERGASAEFDEKHIKGVDIRI